MSSSVAAQKRTSTAVGLDPGLVHPYRLRAGLQARLEAIWCAQAFSRRDSVLADRQRDVLTEIGDELDRMGVPTYDEDIEVPVVDAADITPENFHEVFAKRHPVVIRGLTTDTAAAEWTLDGLRERLAAVNVLTQTKGRGESNVDKEMVYEDGGEVLRAIQGELDYEYFSVSTDVFNAVPELSEEIGITLIETALGIRVHKPELFMASPGNSTPFHCAMADNVLVNIIGRKEWRLVPPAYSWAMYPEFHKVTLGLPFYHSEVVNPLGRPDVVARDYPLYRRVPKLHAVVEPGDLIYNPEMWWHDVKSLTPSVATPLRFNTMRRQPGMKFAHWLTFAPVVFRPSMFKTSAMMFVSSLRKAGRARYQDDVHFRYLYRER